MRDKTCSDCGRSFPATTTYFITESRNVSGIGARCRNCERARKRKQRSPAARGNAGSTEDIARRQWSRDNLEKDEDGRYKNYWHYADD